MTRRTKRLLRIASLLGFVAGLYFFYWALFFATLVTWDCTRGAATSPACRTGHEYLYGFYACVGLTLGTLAASFWPSRVCDPDGSGIVRQASAR